jgi:hypothetical protein
MTKVIVAAVGALVVALTVGPVSHLVRAPGSAQPRLEVAGNASDTDGAALANHLLEDGLPRDW